MVQMWTYTPRAKFLKYSSNRKTKKIQLLIKPIISPIQYEYGPAWNALSNIKPIGNPTIQ